MIRGTMLLAILLFGCIELSPSLPGQAPELPEKVQVDTGPPVAEPGTPPE